MDNDKLDDLNDILSKSKIFFFQKNITKVNLKNKKDNFNIILNKITDSNYSQILESELNNKNINITNYIKLINNLIAKVENEGKFVECYSNFLIDFDRVINKTTKSGVYNIILNKFVEISNSDNEYNKENYYLFIKTLINKGYFYKNLVNKIMMDFVSENNSQNKYIYDSYIWLKLNPTLQTKYSGYISEILKTLNKTNDIRLITLFENLNKKNTTNNTIKNTTVDNKNVDKKIKNNKTKAKCQNIIKEYLILEDFNELKFFVEENNNCKSIYNFLEDAIIHELFINEDEDFEKLLNLLKKRFVNINNIKIKTSKLVYDDIFIDFKERKQYILKIN